MTHYLQAKLYDLVKKDEAIFDFIQSTSLDGLSLWDLNNREKKWYNNLFWQALGYDEKSFHKNNLDWSNYIYPQDKEEMLLELERLLTGQDQKCSLKTRYKQKDGLWKTLDCSGYIVFDANQQAEYLVGIHNLLPVENEEFEKKLIESEARYKRLVETSSDAIYLIDDKGIIIDTNEAAVNMLKRSREDIIGSFIDTVDPNFNVDTFLEFWKSVPFNKQQIFETNHITIDGVNIPIEISGQKTKVGDKTLFYGIARDISKRKTAEEEVRKQRDMFESVINSVSTRIFWKDKDSVYLGCNPNFVLDSGCQSIEEVIGKKDEFFVWGEDAELYRKDDLEVINSGKAKMHYEEPFVSKDGKQITWRTSKMPLKNAAGDTIGIIATSENVTEEMQRKRILQESEEKYRLLAENTSDIIWILDVDENRFTYFSPSTEKIIGFKPEELLGKGMEYVLAKESLNYMEHDVPKRIKRYLEGAREIFKDELKQKCKDGSTIWTEVHARYVRNEKTGHIDAIGTSRDISERLKANIGLKESQSRLASAQKMAKIGSFEHDFVKDTLWWSDELFNILGFEKADMPPNYETFIARMPEKDAEKLNHLVERAQKYGEPYTCTFTYHFPDDTTKHIFVNAEIALDAEGKPKAILGTGQDITDRIKAEMQIKKQNEEYEALNEELKQTNEELYASVIREEASIERFNLAMHSSQDGLFDWNLVTNEIYYSPGWKKMLGYEDHELPNDFSVWEKLTEVEDVKRSWEMQQELINKKRDRFVIEFKMKHKEGHWVDVLSRARAFFDENGKPTRIVGTHTDISERIRAEKELRYAKEKAEEANALKSEFLHNMSHEIRTPMNGIIGFSSLLTNMENANEQQKFYSTIISNSSKQLLRIIDDILEISTLETKQLLTIEKTFDVNSFMLEIFSIYDLKSKDRNLPLYVHKALRDEERFIISDKTKLHKILSNLLDNAFKFTNDGYIEFGYYLEKEQICFYVSDTGIGISDEKQEKIFERFSQESTDTAENYGGLGLGLSIAKENAELLGGDLNVISKKGEGSKFIICIPYKPDLEMQNEARNLTKEKEAKTFTILIAEDEEVNFLYLETILNGHEEMHFEIIHAKNGKEAVNFCIKNPDIDLILMDIKMPFINGYEATEQIKAEKPKLPIIAQTAYSTSHEKELALQHGCDDFISKPIDRDELLELVDKYIL